MRLTEHIYLVGSGYEGFDMTHANDCHVFMIENGGDLALIDIGAGLGVDMILRNITRLGFDIQRIRYVLLTHPHADHAGGVAHLRDRVKSVQAISHKGAAELLENGDEDGIHLTHARLAGVYPADYRLRSFRVDRGVQEGDIVHFGSAFSKSHISFEVIETPGHCQTHVSYLATIDGNKVLFSGDSIFYNGKVHLLNTSDCSIPEYGKTAEKLAKLEVDMLLPGHQMLALRDGKRHLNKAAQIFRNLGIPDKII